ncbi:MAG: ROK family protein [Acidisphaera sp.]|nr:ROK family protein [Acidisphaera sp.]MBV9812090.1 ROK family protein [Acetobacteraceae bacterium]
MADRQPTQNTCTVPHGAADVAGVTVDDYNAAVREGDGFLGDRANKRAFQAILDKWRDSLRRLGEDPLGETPTGALNKKQIDKTLIEGDVEAAGVVHSAVEEFAQELAEVIDRFLRLETWRGTQRIALGGGLRASRVGELAIGRAAVLLKTGGQATELRPIRHHPDEAGLVGCVQLAPPRLLAGCDGMLAVDIGGTKIRAGVVELNRRKAADFSAAHVAGLEAWRHRNDSPERDEAVNRLLAMLEALARRADKDGMRLAPFVGVGCPGRIREDGSIVQGGQNLPGGDWEDEGFNLPRRILATLPEIDGQPTQLVMHNDAVVQGLSEASSMHDVQHWGILTIGTGLGNARFSNRRDRA